MKPCGGTALMKRRIAAGMGWLTLGNVVLAVAPVRRRRTQRPHQGHRPLLGRYDHGLAHRVQEFAHRDLTAEALLDRQSSKSASLPNCEAKLMIVSRSARGRSISLASLETWREPGDFSPGPAPRLLRIDRTTDEVVAVGEGPTQARLGDKDGQCGAQPFVFSRFGVD